MATEAFFVQRTQRWLLSWIPCLHFFLSTGDGSQHSFYPRGLAVALRAQPFSWTLKPPETEWLSFLLPHEPQEAAFPQLRSAGWASEIVRVQAPGPA